jgi:hypothetical protein
MDRIRRCCANCHQPFRADARNAWHQQYCTAPACRAASKAASQRRWLAKPENRDYFRGPEHLQRVQLWRQAHPGYGRREPAGAATSTPKPSQAAPSAATAPLQDLVPTQVVAAQEDSGTAAATAGAAEPCLASPPAPLQDLLQQQPIVLIGLLAHLSASTLQDDIALAGRRLLQLGHDVLGGARA